MEFARQEYWSGLPYPPPGDLPTQGLSPGLLHCRKILYHLSHRESPTSRQAFIIPWFGTTMLFRCYAFKSQTQVKCCKSYQKDHFVSLHLWFRSVFLSPTLSRYVYFFLACLFAEIQLFSDPALIQVSLPHYLRSLWAPSPKPLDHLDSHLAKGLFCASSLAYFFVSGTWIVPFLFEQIWMYVLEKFQVS